MIPVHYLSFPPNFLVKNDNLATTFGSLAELPMAMGPQHFALFLRKQS